MDGACFSRHFCILGVVEEKNNEVILTLISLRLIIFREGGMQNIGLYCKYFGYA
jgi:hypothetical protein